MLQIWLLWIWQWVKTLLKLLKIVIVLLKLLSTMDKTVYNVKICSTLLLSLVLHVQLHLNLTQNRINVFYFSRSFLWVIGHPLPLSKHCKNLKETVRKRIKFRVPNRNHFSMAQAVFPAKKINILMWISPSVGHVLPIQLTQQISRNVFQMK